jgi:hypothetical protein
MKNFEKFYVWAFFVFLFHGFFDFDFVFPFYYLKVYDILTIFFENNILTSYNFSYSKKYILLFHVQFSKFFGSIELEEATSFIKLTIEEFPVNL